MTLRALVRRSPHLQPDARTAGATVGEETGGQQRPRQFSSFQCPAGRPRGASRVMGNWLVSSRAAFSRMRISRTEAWLIPICSEISFKRALATGLMRKLVAAVFIRN